MSLLLSYNLRHIAARRATSGMTVFGIALVVFVFAASQMMANGLRRTLAATGSPFNAIAIRTGAQNEIQSGISREHAAIILSDPAVSKDGDSEIASTDNLVLVSLKKRSDGQPSNVNLRGVSAGAYRLRPEIEVIQGRLPTPGSNEVMAGRSIHEKFAGAEVGGRVRLVGTDWPVVGVFDAGTSAFNSEIWGDVNVLMPAFRRETFTSVTFRMRDTAELPALKERLEKDPRLTIWLKPESLFYEDQSYALGLFIKIMGTFVSVIFSLGAIIGAMITMHSAVAARTREIGILRALGFSGLAVFASFMKECLLIALAGGAAGLLLASLLSFIGVSTSNFMTFSEVAFGFALSWEIAAKSLVFALVMGLIGGALPAWRAARLGIVRAMREA